MAPGMLLAAVGMLLLTRLSVNSAYTTGVLPALVLLGLGMGLTFMPVYATATAGVAPKDAGVTFATVSTFQQIGGSLGTVLLNTIASSAATRYIDAHPSRNQDAGLGLVHGFTAAAWWSMGVLLLAALVAAMAKAPEKTCRNDLRARRATPGRMAFRGIPFVRRTGIAWEHLPQEVYRLLPVVRRSSAAAGGRPLYVHRGLGGDQAPLGLSVDKAERQVLRQLAAGCGQETVEYEPAD
ncbi:hypothetical protein [Streptomyces venezuelae]|uniref:hypothetical protein n=1 Tax=Streptomyces venezuelae TaxID=54571 RepID=UPI003F579DE7